MVLNDAPDQTIVPALSSYGDRRSVYFSNKDIRFATLGDKRNYINSLASYENRIVVDDDDVFLPWFVSSMAAGLEGSTKDGLGFYLASHFIGSSGVGGNFKCELKGRGPAGIPAYTALAFNSAGGYPSMQSGQDQALVSKLSRLVKSNALVCAPGYVYRWANGVYHFSGSGRDGTEYDSAHRAYAKHPLEKRGTLHIEARWDLDYVQACRPALARWAASEHQDLPRGC